VIHSSANPTSPELTHGQELLREMTTMAIYVTVCLLAAVIGLPGYYPSDHPVPAIWGFVLGLAITHWFAFHTASRLIRGGRADRRDAQLAAAQFTGAALVAGLGSLAVVLAPERLELRVLALALGAFIAALVHHGIRSSGGSALRAGCYAAGALVAAIAVVELKHLLS
jgi:hypothetical protein